MTVFGIDGLIKRNTVKRPDRGGKGMNLINAILMKSDDHDRKRQHMNQENNIADDYGYQLYKALEYNTRHMENGVTEFEKMLLNTLMR